ncbi:hypothetical protein BH11CYA1_BH11CYA1_30430 [soil metagenome]
MAVFLVSQAGLAVDFVPKFGTKLGNNFAIDMQPAFAKSFTFNDVAKYPANPYKTNSAAPYPILTKRFINDTASRDWVGGDAAYSIPLGPKRNLWLFGDSFVGQVKNNRRLNCAMVHNAIAIEETSLGSSPGKFTYYNGKQPVDEKSNGTGFFRCPEKGDYYWPADGFLSNGKLNIFMHVVRTNTRLPVPFQFELRTDHLVTIDNPQDAPDKWRYKIQGLNTSAKRTLYGVACRSDSKYQYFFCSNGSVALDLFKHPAVVARLPLDKAASFKVNKLEWWSQKWEPTYELPETLFDDGASEMTVTAVPGLPGFFAFYIPPDLKAIVMRHAQQPQGPWSERAVVYQFPASAPDMLYYSAKAHPQYLKDASKNKGEMILTYCTNSSNFAKLTSNAKLYVPQALKISIGNSKSSSSPSSSSHK